MLGAEPLGKARARLDQGHHLAAHWTLVPSCYWGSEPGHAPRRTSTLPIARAGPGQEVPQGAQNPVVKAELSPLAAPGAWEVSAWPALQVWLTLPSPAFHRHNLGANPGLPRWDSLCLHAPLTQARHRHAHGQLRLGSALRAETNLGQKPSGAHIRLISGPSPVLQHSGRRDLDSDPWPTPPGAATRAFPMARPNPSLQFNLQ